ncbi:MAG: beta strand repeat-containing protein [Prosthecobacter sp.]
MKKNFRISRRLFSSIIFAALLPAIHATAQTSVWDGGTDGSGVTWTTGNNWTTNVAPVSVPTTNLLFDSRNGTGTLPALNLGADRVAGLITFDNVNSVLPATLNIDANASTAAARTLTLHTGITLQNTSTVVAFRGSNGPLSIVLGANNTFTTSSGSLLQISSGVVISGSYGITTAGTGSVALNAPNTFSGGVTVGGGSTFRLGFSSATTDSSSTVTSGVLVSGPAGIGTITVQNGGTVASSGTGDRTVQNNLTLGGNVTFGTAALTGALIFNSTATSGDALTTPATITLLENTVVTAIVGTTFSNVVGGSFSLTKQGTANLTLAPSAANTYSGGTTVAGGTLRYGRTGSLGTGAVTLGATGGGDATLESYLGGWSTANDITVASGSGGTLTLAYTSTATSSANFSGALTLNDNVTMRSESSTSSAMRMTGAISGAGNITKTGVGTLRLESNNTGYSGITTISAGIVQIGNAGTTGGIGTGNIVNNATLVVNRTNAYTLSNVISGSGVLIHNGTGTTSINTENSYTGGTTVAKGTLQIGRTGSLGTGTVTLGSTGGGDATLDNYLAGWTTSNNIVVAAGSGGTLTLEYSSTATGFGSAVFTGSITLNDNLTMRSEAGSGVAMRVQGAISGSSSITKTGAGVLRLENDNTGYSGTTTISTGTLQLGNNSTTGGAGTGNIVNNSALLITRSNSLALTNQISGTGTVTQSGSGTTTLSNANTYSGGTTVNGGALMVTNTSGSATGTGSVAVTSTLGGTGTIAPTGINNVTLAGAVQPGVAGTNNGVGTLSFTPVDGNVIFQNGSGISFEISANGVNDKVLFNASGSARMDFSAMAAGSMGVTFVAGYTPALNDSFDLLDWAAASGTGITGLSTSLLSLSTVGFEASWFWDTTQFTTTGVVSIAGVPELSRAVLVGMGAALLCLRRRRAVVSPK